jgi:hypothetical protein
LAVTSDPQSTAAWDKDASGEDVLGRRMNDAAGPLLRVLHDRRVPAKTQVRGVALRFGTHEQCGTDWDLRQWGGV